MCFPYYKAIEFFVLHLNSSLLFLEWYSEGTVPSNERAFLAYAFFYFFTFLLFYL